MNKYIMHIDVNNAFLSWTAINLLSNGFKEDIRLIPAMIGGDEATRHGVVLAKSNIAKQFGIKTGETIYQAKKKCPQIRIFPTKPTLYKEYSDKLYNLLLGYTNKIERFSIDECFIDFSDIIKSKNDFLKLALELSNKIKKELLFTVNIGLSDNKILAKMASDFEKPDKIHTLYKDEIQEKLWNLPIEELFMVGKIRKYGLKAYTIGIQLKTNEFLTYSHQKKLKNPTNNTHNIYNEARELLDKLYNNQKIRLVGIKLDNLTNDKFNQMSIFDETTNKNKEKSLKLDNVIDNIKDRYGYDSITLGSIMKKD